MLTEIEKDPVFDEAKMLIAATGKVSASLLQRHLNVGYARAARLMDQLEEAKLIGPGRGAIPREVLIPFQNSDKKLKEFYWHHYKRRVWSNTVEFFWNLLQVLGVFTGLFLVRLIFSIEISILMAMAYIILKLYKMEKTGYSF